jgi:hypothetical protein
MANQLHFEHGALNLSGPYLKKVPGQKNKQQSSLIHAGSVYTMALFDFSIETRMKEKRTSTRVAFSLHTHAMVGQETVRVQMGSRQRAGLLLSLGDTQTSYAYGKLHIQVKSTDWTFHESWQ